MDNKESKRQTSTKLVKSKPTREDKAKEKEREKERKAAVKEKEKERKAAEKAKLRQLKLEAKERDKLKRKEESDARKAERKRLTEEKQRLKAYRPFTFSTTVRDRENYVRICKAGIVHVTLLAKDSCPVCRQLEKCLQESYDKKEIASLTIEFKYDQDKYDEDRGDKAAEKFVTVMTNQYKQRVYSKLTTLEGHEDSKSKKIKRSKLKRTGKNDDGKWDIHISRHHRIFFTTPEHSSRQYVNLNLTDIYQYALNPRSTMLPLNNEKPDDNDDDGDSADKVIAKAVRSIYRKHFYPRKYRELMPHQVKWINNWIDVIPTRFQIKLNSYALYWRMGLGKTEVVLRLMALAGPKNVWVVCSNSLIGSWDQTIHQIAQECPFETTYHVLGYTEFAKLIDDDPDLVKGDVVIIDEAHKYRNQTAACANSIRAACTANLLIIVSGTFIIDNVTEAKYLYQFGTMGVKYSDNPDIIPSPEEIKAVWFGRVDYFDASVHAPEFYRKNFPKLQYVTHRIPMLWSQVAQYVYQSENVIPLNQYGGKFYYHHATGNHYDVHTRHISNGLGPGKQPKLDAIAQLVKEYGQFPASIYSHQIENGSDAILSSIKKVAPELRTATLTGKTKTSSRQDIVNRFSKRKLDVLLYSDAAQAGIDLREGLHIVITEPLPNIPTENQTIGRSIRINGYDDPENTIVRISQMLSVFPNTPPTKEDVKEIRKYFESKDLFHKEDFNTIDLAQFMVDYVQNNPMAIDELITLRNETKYQTIIPYEQALQSATMLPVQVPRT